MNYQIVIRIIYCIKNQMDLHINNKLQFQLFEIGYLNISPIHELVIPQVWNIYVCEVVGMLTGPNTTCSLFIWSTKRRHRKFWVKQFRECV